MGDALPIVDLGTGRTAVSIAAGRYATCAILDDKSMKCWGWAGLNGQFAKGDIGDAPGEMGDQLAPLDFGGRRPVHVAISEYAACASMDDETIWCWGEEVTQGPPQMQVGLPSKSVKALSANGGGIIALYDDGTLSPALPGGNVVWTSDRKISAISGANGASTCAILDDSTTVCIEGGNATPVDVPPNAVALGVQFFAGLCALLKDGSVQCLSQACNGTVPVRPYWCGADNVTITLREPAESITSGGADFACALLVDGSVKCWGGDPTKPPPAWLGSEVAVINPDAGAVSGYGIWHAVDLGTHP
jgi:hypothetical protein